MMMSLNDDEFEKILLIKLFINNKYVIYINE